MLFFIKGGVRRRSENVFREKVSGKKKYVRGKRTHKLTAPGRTKLQGLGISDSIGLIDPIFRGAGGVD